MRLPPRKKFAYNRTELTLNVTASIIASAIVGVLGKSFVYAFASLVVVFLVVARVRSGPNRRRQDALARVLREPSASRSAVRALRLVRSALLSGASNEEVLDAIDLITEKRPYPHAQLLAPTAEALRAGRADHRELAWLLQTVESELMVARNRIRRNLADFIESLPSSATIVLYGYSTTAVDALTSIGRELPNPIVIVEDRQYGSASVVEHEIVRKQLKAEGLQPTTVTFESFVDALGSTATDHVITVSGRRRVLPRSGGFVAILGCEASDDEGVCLVPAATAGHPSETTTFVGLFRPAPDGEGPRRLVVASESYKMVESCGAGPHTTSAPLSVPLWITARHWLGGAIPFRSHPVNLVRLRTEVSDILSDRGWVESPFNSGELRAERQRWAQRLVSDLQRPARRSLPAPGPGVADRVAAVSKIDMFVKVADLRERLDTIPGLSRPRVVAANDVDDELAEALLPLIASGFPERSWTAGELRAAVLDGATLRSVFALFDDREPIGVVTLHRTGRASQARLHWLTVAEGRRRSHVALGLLSGLADEAARQAFDTVRLTTEKDKLPALRLYQRLGFSEKVDSPTLRAQPIRPAAVVQRPES